MSIKILRFAVIFARDFFIKKWRMRTWIQENTRDLFRGLYAEGETNYYQEMEDRHRRNGSEQISLLNHCPALFAEW